ncbi:MAG: putative DNA binding domain-containing protein, partial [Spirochaetales bacterium]|nr:putative DNA binding domain-containing protein [Spirochaetales bacterium]
MIFERIERLLTQTESTNLEFKTAGNAVPKNLFETICAFLNREGGDILLGVDDTGSVKGIEPTAVEKISQDIITQSNNCNLLDPSFILFSQKYEVEGKVILHIAVPESSRVHRYKGTVYDRSNDCDFKVTSPEQIASLSNQKANFYADAKSYPYLTTDDFELDTIEKAKSIIAGRKSTHPWVSLSIEDMLLKAGLFKKDYKTGTGSYTLAAALLFGKEEVIQSLLPTYKTDLLLRRDNPDRYDDRIDVRVNLIESFFIIMDFIDKNLPDPFYLEKEQRISLRDIIFREAVVNMLVHRNFMGQLPARINIYKNSIEMQNPSLPLKKGLLNAKDCIPHQKNPLISKFFLQLGWVEEIGSGIINISRYYPHFAPKGKFELIEDDYFQAIFNFEGPVEGPV